eukprot:Gb_09288 [translate_table: standard]
MEAEEQRALLELQVKIMKDKLKEEAQRKENDLGTSLEKVLSELISLREFSVSSIKVRATDCNQDQHASLIRKEKGQNSPGRSLMALEQVRPKVEKGKENSFISIPKHSKKITQHEYEVATSDGRKTITKRKRTKSTVMFGDASADVKIDAKKVNGSKKSTKQTKKAGQHPNLGGAGRDWKNPCQYGHCLLSAYWRKCNLHLNTFLQLFTGQNHPIVVAEGGRLRVPLYEAFLAPFTEEFGVFLIVAMGHGVKLLWGRGSMRGHPQVRWFIPCLLVKSNSSLIVWHFEIATMDCIAYVCPSDLPIFSNSFINAIQGKWFVLLVYGCYLTCIALSMQRVKASQPCASTIGDLFGGGSLDPYADDPYAFD